MKFSNGLEWGCRMGEIKMGLEIKTIVGSFNVTSIEDYINIPVVDSITAPIDFNSGKHSHLSLNLFGEED